MSICGIFELYYAQRHTIDEKKNVRASVFNHTVVHVLHCKLIDYAEHVCIRVFKVNQLNHTAQAILRSKLDAVDHPAVQLMQCRKIAFSAGQPNPIHDLSNFFG